jgi:paraquat-inducible protein B
MPVITALVRIALIDRGLFGRGRRIEESFRMTEGLDAAGTQFLLHVEDAGSLGVGSPVFFRRIKVGQVAARDSDGDGRGAMLQIFLTAHYDNVEGANTRFWHTSGFDLQFISSGQTPSAQSLTSPLLWGVAFGAPDDVTGSATREKTSFALAGDEPPQQPDDNK